MKTLILAAAVASALAASAISAQAQNETDKAMGAGSYIHPNGGPNGAWGSPEAAKSYKVGLTEKKPKQH